VAGHGVDTGACVPSRERTAAWRERGSSIGVDEGNDLQSEELPAVRVITPTSPAVLAHEALGRTSVSGDAKSSDGGAGVSELDAYLAVRVLAAWPVIVVDRRGVRPGRGGKRHHPGARQAERAPSPEFGH
jgi:hypothetical protein